ncbi:uncharacterized protein LOC143836527, partial [Paroedura picta]|uniref:uncharacterized protein LOC143836527 n=1 Tax=Paroedura picta TaxID=143630 RepID=UPI0040572FBC
GAFIWPVCLSVCHVSFIHLPSSYHLSVRPVSILPLHPPSLPPSLPASRPPSPSIHPPSLPPSPSLPLHPPHPSLSIHPSILPPSLPLHPSILPPSLPLFLPPARPPSPSILPPSPSLPPHPPHPSLSIHPSSLPSCLPPARPPSPSIHPSSLPLHPSLSILPIPPSPSILPPSLSILPPSLPLHPSIHPPSPSLPLHLSILPPSSVCPISSSLPYYFYIVAATLWASKCPGGSRLRMVHNYFEHFVKTNSSPNLDSHSIKESRRFPQRSACRTWVWLQRWPRQSCLLRTNSRPLLEGAANGKPGRTDLGMQLASFPWQLAAVHFRSVLCHSSPVAPLTNKV